MVMATGTATDHANLFALLRTFLTTSTGGGGAGWTELRYDGVNNRVLLRAPGLSGTEEIHFGFGYVADNPNDAYALTGWMYKMYEPTFGDLGQPGTSLVRYQPVWDSAIPYWFKANGQRIIIITKISTSYFSSYLGKFLPRSAPSDYPQPYYLGMVTDANNRWSLASSDNRIRSFFDPGPTVQILQPSGNWQSGGNFSQSSSESTMSTSGCYVWPYNGNVFNSVDVTRWREMRNNLDGSYPRFALELLADSPTNDLLGELDGAYAIPGFSAASEDIIQIDSIDHLMIQDGAKTNRWNYCGVSLD
jgi:hypothetical protein